MRTTYNKIERETEKAMLVEFNVYRTEGCEYAHTMWVPKSAAKVIDASSIEIADWLAKKIEKESAVSHSSDKSIISKIKFA